MCTIDAFIERHTTVLREHLGMPCEPSTLPDGDRQIMFKISTLWCTVPVTAPMDPELVVIRCQVGLPSELDAAAAGRIVARLNRRSALTKAIAIETGVIVTTASLAAPPDCLPSIENLVAVLPRLRAAMATTLSGLREEIEFECLTAGAEAERDA